MFEMKFFFDNVCSSLAFMKTQSNERCIFKSCNNSSSKNKLCDFCFLSIFKLLVLTVILFSSFVTGFNLDVDTALIHRGPSGTYYGFSVAQHKDRGESWLLVGAPLAQSNQPNVDKGGVVYRCRADSINTCQPILFDEKGPATVTVENGILEYAENKSGQWFGATVSSSGENGRIVACAPRYVYHLMYPMRRLEPLGMCFISTGAFIGIIPLEPCKRQDEWGYHRLGSCQVGYSAAISEDGKRLYMGAVGSYYWQGQVYSYDFANSSNYVYTRESPEKDDDVYLGYSMTLGKFGKDNSTCVASGMPKGSNLKGKVVIYTETLQNIYNVSGDQIGSYFGASLATSDVNGDGLDDFVVGAPFYTPISEKETGYEHGAIYVYYQTKKGEFERKDLIVGKKSKARFGMSVSRIGDVNKDGFDDIAVGAPYDGDTETGAVYIFNGDNNGLNAKHSQVIYAEQFGEFGLQTFGYSLSGGMDMDRNQYPDLFVGAYSSDRAIQLLARPIVNVNATFKLEPENIGLDNAACGLDDGSRYPCSLATLCFNYTGIKVDNRLTFIYEVRIDSKSERIPRAYMLNKPNRNLDRFTIDLVQNGQRCTSFYVYLSNNLRDKLTPIEVEIEYNISIPFSNPRYVKPILNKQNPNVLKSYINILKNCGPDNVCIPNLKLNVTAEIDRYLIGSDKKIELEVTLANEGEDAFETTVNVHMPLDINYVNINKTKLDLPITCVGANPERTGENLLKCDLGNPLPANHTRVFTVILEPSEIVSAAPDFTFIFRANSSNLEPKNTTDDNQVVIGLPIRVQVNLTSKGASSPSLVLHNVDEPIEKTKSSEVDIGEQVFHIYQLHNRGPSSITKTDITILWPSKTLKGKFLLYLMDQPEITGSSIDGTISDKVFCQTITLDELNPLGLPSRKSSSHPGGNETSLSNILGDEPYLASFHEFDDKTLQTLIRERRHNKPLAYTQSAQDLSFDELMSCGPTICTRIQCTIENFKKDEKLLFSIRSRLWKETIQEVGLKEFEISSRLVARVTQLPHNVDPKFMPPEVVTVTTKVQLIGLDKPSPISLWIIILAIIGGLLLLALLVLALWKLGFFKRKRPPTAGSESEPLQENGYNYRKGDTSL